MDTSDQEINRGVRTVLTRHWLDLTGTSFASRRGIVRMIGELKRIGADAAKPIDQANLETLDSELRRVRGVKRVHFDLANWRKNDEGEWENIAREEPRGSGSEGSDGDLSRDPGGDAKIG